MRKTRNQASKRILAALLVLVMLVGIFPVSVFASGSYTITVQDSDGAAVAGASVSYAVTVDPNGTPVQFSGTATTDDTGVAVVDLSAYAELITAENPASISYTVSKEGYTATSSVATATGAVGGTTATLPLAEQPKATVTVTCAGDALVRLNGVAQNTVTVDQGSEVSVEIIPAAGSYIKELTVAGTVVTVEKGGAYIGTITADADIAVNAVLVKEVTVSAPAAVGGKITLNGVETNSLTVDAGASVTVVVTGNSDAAAKYYISSLSIGGVAQNFSADPSTYTTTINPTEDVVVAASFEQIYTTTVKVNGNGTVTTTPEHNGGTIVVKPADATEEIIVTATPAENHRVYAVKIDGTADATVTGANDSGYTTKLTAKAYHEVEVTFALNSYAVVASSTTNGTITATPAMVDHGKSVEVTLTPAAGYTVKSAAVNGVVVSNLKADGLSGAIFTIENVTGPQTVTAEFVEISDAVATDYVQKTALNIDNGVHVYGGSTDAVFSTTRDGIRLWNSDNALIGYQFKTETAPAEFTVPGDATVAMVEVYYKAEGEAVAAWHPVSGFQAVQIAYDVTAPVITVGEIPAFVNADAEIEITVTDAQPSSGIMEVSYLFGEQSEQSGVVELDAEGKGILKIAVPKGQNYASKFQVAAVDNAGKINIVSIPEDGNVTVDSIAPVVKIAAENGHYQTEQKVTITIIEDNFDATDATDAIVIVAEDADKNEVADSYVVSEWVKDSEIENKYTAEIMLKGNANYTINCSYTDAAGNPGNSVSATISVDNVAPTGSIKIEDIIWDKLANVLTFGRWSQTGYAVFITADDLVSGIKSVEYYVTSDAMAMDQAALGTINAWKSYDENNVPSITGDQNFVVYAKITDNCGNTTYISSQGHIIDSTGASFELTPNTKATDGVYWYKADETPTVAVAGISDVTAGIKSIDYKVMNNGVVTQEANVFKFEVADPEYAELVKQYDDFDIVVDSEKNNSSNVEVVVTVTDNAGNVTEDFVKLDIDITAPEINVAFDNNTPSNVVDGYAYFNAHRTATVTFTERSNHFDETSAIIITATNAGEADKYDEIKVPAIAWTHKEGTTPDEDTHTATIEFKDGNYTFTINPEDMAGNEGEIKYAEGTKAKERFAVDTTEPTAVVTASYGDRTDSDSWNALATDTLIFGYWSNVSIAVSIDTDDVTSPIQSVEYAKYVSITPEEYTQALDPTEEITAWNTVNNDDLKAVLDILDVTENEQFVVYFKVTDMAGNVSYFSTGGLIVDKDRVEEMTKPVITITTPGKEYYNGDVNLSVDVYDPIVGNREDSEVSSTYSGIKSVTYTVKNMGSESQTGALIEEFSIKNPIQEDLWQKINTQNILVDSSKNNSNDVVVAVTAFDNAGNVSTATVNLKIDITAPTISVSYDNNNAENGTYFNADRTATIVVTERNFNASNVNVTLKNTDGIIPTVNGWTKSEGSGNGDDTTWTATVNYVADGDYTFAVSCSDQAGNASAGTTYNGTAPTEFTIDQTKPVVKVSYDNNSVKNERYFNKDRVATVEITEHNFDVNRVDFTQTAALDGEKIDIPEATWTHSGDVHTAKIVYDTDGDYTFDVSVEDMVSNKSGAADYGTSKAPKSFTLDKTIKTPVITGVKDGKAYQDEVIPGISFTDVNYDSYEIQLLRTRKDEKDVDVTEEFIGEIEEELQGGSGTFDTFGKIPENDGIYTLIVKMTDKAGNEKTKTVVFTVNRFGSVYTYSDYLISLIQDGGIYANAIIEDLVICEFNPDRLVEESLVIEITRDGKPLEDVIFEVTPVINDKVEVGESGWFEYQYTISKDNFLADGIYKISVSSEDATGNQPENDNFEDMGIQFKVDSTCPEITSVVGLEESIINAHEVTVKYDIFDTIGLKSIAVYVDGAQVGDLITDFSADQNNYSGSFVIGEKSSQQTVQLVVEDLAGNVTDTGSEKFTSAYRFNKRVTVSTNAMVRWYANKPLFWGSIGGAVVLIGLLAILITAAKRKRKTVH